MLTAHSDANWARHASDRRSISGGVLMHGCQYIKSHTQSPIALSSAESELYALVKATADAMEFVSVIRDVGQSWSTVVHGGGSAALGVMQRLGLG